MERNSLEVRSARARCAKDKPLINCIVEDGKFKDDFFGDLTICNVPDSLLKEFMRTVVWPKYPGGISEALSRPDEKKSSKTEETRHISTMNTLSYAQ